MSFDLSDEEVNFPGHAATSLEFKAAVEFHVGKALKLAPPG